MHLPPTSITAAGAADQFRGAMLMAATTCCRDFRRGHSAATRAFGSIDADARAITTYGAAYGVVSSGAKMRAGFQKGDAGEGTLPPPAYWARRALSACFKFASRCEGACCFDSRRAFAWRLPLSSQRHEGRCWRASEA